MIYESRETVALNDSACDFNALLAGFGLESFQLRFFKKCMNFIYRIHYNELAPQTLKDHLCIEEKYELEELPVTNVKNKTDREVRHINLKKKGGS